MEWPTLLLALCWGGLCHLALLQLGSLAGKGASLLERLATGWLLSMALAYVAMGTGRSGSKVLVALACLLALWWLMTRIKEIHWAGLRLPRFKTRNLSRGETALWTLALALAAVRLGLALLPLNNWDSLNHHLPLLLSRLTEGGWSPMPWVATERRTPLFSILPKLWATALDPTGRALVVQHLLLGISLLWGLARLIRSRFPDLFWAMPLLMIWSLSDIWRHLLTAGDEIWMVLGTVSFVALCWERVGSRRQGFIAVAVLVAGMGIKATAIFYVLPFGLAGFFFLRGGLLRRCLGVAFGVILAGIAMGPNLWNYNMAYPFNRWSDLLSTEAPEVLSSQEVKVQRASLGLADHRDNLSPGSKALVNLKNNLEQFPRLALGPYLIWALLGMILLGKGWARNWPQGSASTLTLSMLAVFLAMLAWNFSPQALYRYLLPVWWVFLLSLGVILAGTKAFAPKWLGLGVGLMLLFALGLEGRELIRRSQQPHPLSPQRHWLATAHDGPLIDTWLKQKSESDRAFYIGSLSLMMVDQERHWLAQLGNETGWRRPEDLKSFLAREGIDWWIFSFDADRLDPVYRKLTERLKTEGVLERVSALESGEIYRVKLGRVKDL